MLHLDEHQVSCVRWHNQHFYGILDETNTTAVLPPALSYNTGIIPLPVKDARQHARSVKVSSWHMFSPGHVLQLSPGFPGNNKNASQVAHAGVLGPDMPDP